MKKFAILLSVIVFVFIGIQWGTVHAHESLDPADVLSVQVLNALLSFKGSACLGVKAEEWVKEDILGKYIPQIVVLEKKKNPSLSNKEAEDQAYMRIVRVWYVVVTTEKDVSTGDKAGLVIFKRILQERGIVVLKSDKQKTDEKVLESEKGDTSIY